MIRDRQVGLVWLGQSGFTLRFPTARVLIDPFLSRHPDRLVPPALNPAEARGFEIVACTHEHLDHLDQAALPLIAEASPTALFIAPEPCVEVLITAGVPLKQIVGMQPDRPIECSGIEIHAVPACHGVHAADAYNFGEKLSGGAVRFLGYVLRAGGVAVYHAGDTIAFDGLADRLRKLRIDLALLPINGRDPQREAKDIVGNLDADEAAQLAAESGAKTVIPMHYDMFAANRGFPEELVERVRTTYPELAVMVPARGAEFIHTKTE